MNEVECSGFEKSLTECLFNRDSVGCSHEEDAAVRCNIPAMGFNMRVRNSICHIKQNQYVLVTLQETTVISCIFLSSASVKWRPEPVWRPRGGPGREERVSGVGNCMQWQLGHNGGHGGVQTAGLGLCQQCFPGKRIYKWLHPLH